VRLDLPQAKTVAAVVYGEQGPWNLTPESRWGRRSTFATSARQVKSKDSARSSDARARRFR